MLPDFIAAKRLAASDLTFFERLFRILNVSGQKSITLNADVLTGEFYPDLDNFLDPDSQELRLGLDIYGPAAAGRYHVTRKIIKGGSYKNWRLNGEFIYDPEDKPHRFDPMRAGDIAIIGFDGKPAPSTIRLVLLARADHIDGTLHSAIAPLIPGGRKSMVSLTQAQLTAALAQPGVPDGHPLALLALDPVAQAALEDAAQAGLRGIRAVDQRRHGRPVTKAELERAKRSADATGAAGEELVNDYLTALQANGGIPDFSWASAGNAISPYDFAVLSQGGSAVVTRIDVKASKGPFDTAFHISLAEIACAAQSATPYVIYRVFDLTGEGGKIGVSGDIREFAQALYKAHADSMPGEVAADSFSVPVNTPGLTWAEPVYAVFAKDDGDPPDIG